MEKTYTKEDLCEQVLNNISVATFDRHKKKYLAILEESFIVEIIKGARGKLSYKLTPKAPTMYVNIKPKTAEKVDLILKALIVDKVIPVIDEIVKSTGLTESTVKRTIKLMRNEGIILEPKYETRYILDEETGEVLHKWEQKLCSYTYYDKVSEDIREKLDYTTTHQNFGKFFTLKLRKLQHELRQNFELKKGLQVAGITALKDLTEYYGAVSVRRKENYSINKQVSDEIKSKYGRQ